MRAAGPKMTRGCVETMGVRRDRDKFRTWLAVLEGRDDELHRQLFGRGRARGGHADGVGRYVKRRME